MEAIGSGHPGNLSSLIRLLVLNPLGHKGDRGTDTWPKWELPSLCFFRAFLVLMRKFCHFSLITRLGASWIHIPQPGCHPYSEKVTPKLERQRPVPAQPGRSWGMLMWANKYTPSFLSEGILSNPWCTEPHLLSFACCSFSFTNRNFRVWWWCQLIVEAPGRFWNHSSERTGMCLMPLWRAHSFSVYSGAWTAWYLKHNLHSYNVLVISYRLLTLVPSIL